MTEDTSPDSLAQRLRLDSSYPTSSGPRHYHVQRVKTGFCLMFGAGTVSGLLGIGSGALKVVAMDQAMRIPFKVSGTPLTHGQLLRAVWGPEYGNELEYLRVYVRLLRKKIETERARYVVYFRLMHELL